MYLPSGRVSTIRVSGWDKEVAPTSRLFFIPFAYANGTDFSTTLSLNGALKTTPHIPQA